MKPGGAAAQMEIVTSAELNKQTETLYVRFRKFEGSRNLEDNITSQTHSYGIY